MKLVIPARALGRRITVLATAFVLAVSTLTAAVPFVLSETASAVSGPTVLGSGFGYLQGWTDDRHGASGGYSQTNDALTMHVDGDDDKTKILKNGVQTNASNPDNTFYWTEGRHASLPVAAESIKATLHLDPEWETKVGVRAGLWGVTEGNPAAYPIVEFSNRNDSNEQIAGTPRLQVWNTVTGSWTTINVPLVYGNDYEFEVVFNDEAGRFDFFVNGSLEHSYSALYGAFDEVIFNQYNAHIAGNDYTVAWKNFAAGNYSGVPETNLEVVTGAGNTTNALVTGMVGDKFVVRGQASDDNDLSRVYVQLNKSTGGRFGGTTVHLDGKSDDWAVAYDASDLGFVNGDKIRAHVSVTDTKGKTSTVGWTSFMTVDTGTPTVTVKTGTSTVSGSSSTDPYKHISFKLFDAAGNLKEVVLNGHVYNRSGKYNDFNWVNVNKSHVNQGSNTVTVRDKAGNESSMTFNYDTVAPHLTVDAPAGFVTNNDSLEVTGTVSDANLKEYRYQILDENKQTLPDSVGWSRFGGNTNVNNGTLFTADISTLSEGTYYVSVWASDKAGNATNSPGNRFNPPYVMKFTIDRSAPTVTLNPFNLTSNQPTITGTVNDPDAKVWVTVGTVSGLATRTSDSTWSYTVPTALVANNYAVSAVATDAAGNNSTPAIGTLSIVAVPPLNTGGASGDDTNTTGDDDSEDDDNTVLGALTTVTPQITNPSSAVLGTDTESDDEDGATGAAEVKGGSDVANNLAAVAGNTDGNALGLAWYWWLLIIAGGSTIIWGITSAFRGRPSDL